jgi:hypothetical protein
MREDSDKRDARKRHKTKRPGVYYRNGADGWRHYCVTHRDSDGRQRWRNVTGGIEEAQAALDAELRLRRKPRVTRLANGRSRRRDALAPPLAAPERAF